MLPPVPLLFSPEPPIDSLGFTARTVTVTSSEVVFVNPDLSV